ncbi:hypothetical protein FCV25MIE_02272, partial [Fagus crenata]
QGYCLVIKVKRKTDETTRWEVVQKKIKLSPISVLILPFLFRFAIGFSKIEPFLGFTTVNNNCMLKDRDVEVGVIRSVTRTVALAVVYTSRSC